MSSCFIKTYTRLKAVIDMFFAFWLQSFRSQIDMVLTMWNSLTCTKHARQLDRTDVYLVRSWRRWEGREAAPVYNAQPTVCLVTLVCVGCLVFTFTNNTLLNAIYHSVTMFRNVIQIPPYIPHSISEYAMCRISQPILCAGAGQPISQNQVKLGEVEPSFGRDKLCHG